MLLSFFTIEARVTSADNSNQCSKTIDLNKWDRAERSVVPNPIECYLTDECIEVRFIEQPKSLITIQIKDIYGNIVFQDMGVNVQQDVFKIDISFIQSGSYEFYYLDEATGLKGEFEIE